LNNHGYEVGKTIYGAPFDWRLGTHMPDSFWTNLTQLCEKAYNENGHSRVILIGHSLGGFIAQRFLTQHSTPEWRETYIDSAVLSAPSFGGSGLAFSSLVTGKLPLISAVVASRVTIALRTIGSLHSQMPNHVIFGNTPLGYEEDGTPITAADFPRILEERGIVDKDIFSVNRDEPAIEPQQPDVPVAIVYNTGIDTVTGFDFRTNTSTYGKGDVVVNAQGPLYACNNWVNSNYNNKQ